jgi:hypothetical protein
MAPSHIKSTAMNSHSVIETGHRNPYAAAIAVDASGYQIFSDGDQGGAHVFAHHMTDTDQHERGRQVLGGWLDSHTGSGSQWVHLHFHMAIFELGTGHWDAAYRRYLEHVMPTAENSEDALTDAPALLWRLALSASEGTELEWEPLRQTALRRMRRPSDSFTELHNLLALAGAGDLGSLDTFVKTRTVDASCMRLVFRLATALSAYVKGHYHRAADLLCRLLPRIPEIGGSRAQIQLFEQMAAASARKAASSGQPSWHAQAC